MGVNNAIERLACCNTVFQFHLDQERIRFPHWLKLVLVGLVVLGVVFRFVNLNHKVYWHDEAYTSMRAAGYTRIEIDQTLFQNKLFLASELQQFQRIKPGSTPLDTLRSLAVEDPQHPPLYFLMTRFWMQTLGGVLGWIFHSELTTTRSLPALLSLFALPGMYVLAWELFASPAIALLATMLLALSPFDVLFAQTARQYSLLTAIVIISSALLLRALRLSKTTQTLRRYSRKPLLQWINWGSYAGSITVGFYTHPFFVLTLAAHLVYLHGLAFFELDQRSKPHLILMRFWLSVGAALVLYSPWLWVMLTNRQRAFATTDWTQIFPSMSYLLKLWVLSFTSLFFDFDFGFYNPWTVIARVPFLVLIAVSFYILCRRTQLPVWLFVSTSFLVPFLLLALPDLIVGGKRSAVSRYLISCYPAVQLAVAYFLSTQFTAKTVYSDRSQRLKGASTAYSWLMLWLWRGILAGVVVACLSSLTAGALATSWWNKDLSYFNDKTAELVNQATSPLIISDIGIDFTNTGDLLSLSYRLKPDVLLLLIKDPEFVNTEEFRFALQGTTAFVFRPKGELKTKLDKAYGIKTASALKGERIWTLK
jgi:uncharacterized membrane protein